MKQWEKVIHFSALLFGLFSVVGALFFPAHIPFIFDDLFFPFGIIYLAINFFKYSKWRWLILAFGALAAWGMLSDILANGTLRTAPIGMLVRWLKWPIMCISIAELSQLRLKRSYVENGVVIAFLAMAGMNIFMMINPFGMGRELSEMYTQKLEILLSNYHEFGAFRLSGMMRNPNTNAVLFGLFLIYFLHVNARKYWQFILLAFILIFLTQSRTVMIVMLAVFLLYFLSSNKRKTNLIIIPAGVLSLALGLFLFRSTSLMSIFNGSAFQSNSWTQRVEHYDILLQSGIGKIFTGHGIVLDPIASTGFYFDSEYLSIGYQYGLIGLVIWLTTICLIVYHTRKNNRKSTFGWSLLLFILGVAITNFTFLNVECATLMMVLVGAWIFLQSEDKLNGDSNEQSEKYPV